MDDEILVHISAPATRQNDELFRSLSEAYVDFVPHVRHGYERHHQVRETIAPVDCRESATPGPAEISILSTSKDSYGSFPSLLSSGDRISNETNHGEGPAPEPIDDGSIPTSSRLAHLDRIQTHWKEQKAFRSSFASEHHRDPRPSENIATAFVEDTQLGAQALQSQLFDSYSATSEDTSDDEVSEEAAGNGQTQADQVHETTAIECVEATASGTTPVSLAHSGSPADQSVTSQPHPATTTHLYNLARQDVVGYGLSQRDFGKLPIDVFAPAPKVSVECPGKLPSQVTKHLAAVKAHNPKRFQPNRKCEAPKSDDRGYWSVDCSRWSTEVQHEFWTAVCEHVRSGRLGWGVSLHREALSPQNLGLVRVYCWAEVVEHVWLLLWLCSKGQVAISGSTWIDASGDVIFEALS
ncbi:hypothetical protein BKA63DRAFT_283407 [Paraphoma chrysanthemicola]|nr:hypothetical protein BKA63DRAFT_283407 [Paraphoma chrysanthemicola]